MVALIIFPSVFLAIAYYCEKKKCDKRDLYCIREVKKSLFNGFCIRFAVLITVLFLIYYFYSYSGGDYLLTPLDVFLVAINGSVALLLRRVSFDM